jgi:hypothetical protein
MKKYLYLICLSVLVSCGTKNTVVQDGKALYTIDVDKLKHQNTIYASSIFKSVRTIILEDTDDALIGDISRIKVSNNYIFVLDAWIAKKLFVFDKNGKYLRQIGSKGQGPGEYLTIMDFCIDAEKREVYILDYFPKKVHKYNLDTGEYISSINLPKGDIVYLLISCAYDKLYLKLQYFGQQQNDNLLMEFDIQTGKSTEYLSAKECNFGWNEAVVGNFFVSEQIPLKYVELLMNTVYSIEKDTIYPYLYIKSKNWVQKNITTEEYGDGIRQAYNINTYFEYDDYIHLKYFSKGNEYTVVYNKKTNEANIYDRTQNDLLISKGHCLCIYHYVDYQTSKAYEYTSFQNFKYFIENDDDYDIVSDLDKKEELMKLDDEQFIIFEYEFK